MINDSHARAANRLVVGVMPRDPRVGTTPTLGHPRAETCSATPELEMIQLWATRLLWKSRGVSNTGRENNAFALIEGAPHSPCAKNEAGQLLAFGHLGPCQIRNAIPIMAHGTTTPNSSAQAETRYGDINHHAFNSWKYTCTIIPIMIRGEKR